MATSQNQVCISMCRGFALQCLSWFYSSIHLFVIIVMTCTLLGIYSLAGQTRFFPFSWGRGKERVRPICIGRFVCTMPQKSWRTCAETAWEFQTPLYVTVAVQLIMHGRLIFLLASCLCFFSMQNNVSS